MKLSRMEKVGLVWRKLVWKKFRKRAKVSMNLQKPSKKHFKRPKASMKLCECAKVSINL